MTKKMHSKNVGNDERFKVVLAEYYAHAVVIVDKKYKIKEVSGMAQHYLRSLTDIIDVSLETLLKQDLRSLVFALIEKSEKKIKPVSIVVDALGEESDRVKVVIEDCPELVKLTFSKVLVEGMDAQGNLHTQLESKLIDLQKRTQSIENVINSFDYAVMVVNQEFEMYKYNEVTQTIMRSIGCRTFQDFLNYIGDRGLETDLANNIKSVLAGKKDRHKFEYSIQIEGFEPQWFACTVSSISNAEDFICGAVLVHDDITDRKSFEDRLMHEKNESEDQNKRKTLFLANLSHELKSPLNAVMGFSDLLSEGIMKQRNHADLKKYTENIREGSVHLDSIVKRILDMAKIQSGTMVLREETVTITEIYNGVMAIVSGLFPHRQINLEISRDAKNILLYCDKNLTMELMINLITNALKYSNHNDVVDLAFRYVKGHELVLEVSDRGFGMNPEEIKVALEPFGQNLRHFESRNSGLGLGLPFSMHIAEIHGGKLEIVSEKNKGTRVIVSYPISRVHTIV